jgi:predicted transcriptional regulator
MKEEPRLPDDFFTPERLKEIDEAVAEADAGLLLTCEELDQYLAEHKAKHGAPPAS